MAKTIVGLFEQHEKAESAVRELTEERLVVLQA